ncbi:phage tail protein [Bradyrhizobium sp. AUGA SZCCT0222]|uniref:phage tail protein n=1 Tax=Bradyrhizobium sp. AUGA SZCCT0222 TaxID=2807668 RepID=UPI001BACB67B|nr:tail fiber protein [Bradyrhizobium sp. AUGA SZCCT0222]MBR1266843.1 phage tail protein [Bradyrhizobium sp. AUGA SZCCT0222]
MAEPFLSEIRMMSFGFAPQGWALCNGQTLPINQNQALFSLLGTTYGGNGQTTFQLPNLQGRVPNHTGGIGHFLGQIGGEQSHTLSIAELPSHTHFAQASGNAGNSQDGANNVLGVVPGRLYADLPGQTTLSPTTISTVGGSQAHTNMQPFLTVSFCIALQGIFPSQN